MKTKEEGGMNDQDVWCYNLARKTDQRLADIMTVYELMKNNQEKTEKLIAAASAVGVNAAAVARVIVLLEGK